MKNVTLALRTLPPARRVINFGALFHILASNALLQAMAKLWLKLDIIMKEKQKQDSRLLAVSRVTAPNLPLPATWGLSSSSARMD